MLRRLKNMFVPWYLKLNWKKDKCLKRIYYLTNIKNKNIKTQYNFLPFVYTVPIKPDKIKKVLLDSAEKEMKRCSSISRMILFGDWDNDTENLMEFSSKNPRYATLKTINQIITEDKEMIQTDEYFEILNSKVSEKEKEKHLQRLNIQIKMCIELKNNEFKSQQELGLIKNNYGDEIQVYIDREGDFILGWGGTHRLIASKLLNITEVTANVCGIHKLWIEKNLTEGDDIFSIFNKLVLK